jgi:hypothetical protein
MNQCDWIIFVFPKFHIAKRRRFGKTVVVYLLEKGWEMEKKKQQKSN